VKFSEALAKIEEIVEIKELSGAQIDGDSICFYLKDYFISVRKTDNGFEPGAISLINNPPYVYLWVDGEFKYPDKGELARWQGGNVVEKS